MNPRDIFSGIFMLILVYLLVINGSNTTNVISSLGSFLTNETATLQGRGSSSSSSAIQPITIPGIGTY